MRMERPIPSVKPPLSNRILPGLAGLLLALAAGCAVQPGNDPALEARERELKDARETLTQLKNELDGFKSDREAIVTSVRQEAEASRKGEIDALKAQLAERERKIEEMGKAGASAPVTAKVEMATVTFTSGRTTTCQVLNYKDGKLTVKLPSGQTTQAGLSGIQSIEWQGGEASGQPSSSVKPLPPALPETPSVAPPAPRLASALPSGTHPF